MSSIGFEIFDDIDLASSSKRQFTVCPFGHVEKPQHHIGVYHMIRAVYTK